MNFIVVITQLNLIIMRYKFRECKGVGGRFLPVTGQSLLVINLGLLNAEFEVMWVFGEGVGVRGDTYPLAVPPEKMQKINL